MWGQEANWPVSTPEKQGVDAGKLLEMIETVRKENRHIHSILVVRHGVLLLEAYFSPYKRDFRHIIYSATKSITSLLVGIAMREGFVRSLDTPLIDLFPEYKGKVDNPSAWKDALTLESVLNMTDGLDWTDWPYRVDREGDFMKLMASQDPVKYYLDKPMRDAPGKRFNYNSGSSFLLSAVIQKTTGRSILDYGREKLFRPLGIADVSWGMYHRGIFNGASELFLRPRDLARIGCLLLNKGKWEGKEIVPAAWMDEISRERVKSDFLQFGYSRQWYIDETLPERSISAQGLGAQCLFVVPGLDMVVVFTAGMTGRGEDAITFAYLRDYILPAVHSVQPLPANSQANKMLTQALRECENPLPQPVGPLPPIAKEISGAVYSFPERDKLKNLWGVETISLTFDRKDECRLRMTFSPQIGWFSLGFDAVFRSFPGSPRVPALEAVVGLDDVYRTVMVPTIAGVMPYSAKGRWKNERTFEIMSLSGWSLNEPHTFEFQTDGSVVYSCRTIFYSFSLRGNI